MIVVIINGAPVVPMDRTRAATAAIFFSRTPIAPTPGAFSISIINWTFALSPGAPTVVRPIGLPAIPWRWAASLLWAPIIRCRTTPPTFRWWWWTPVSFRATAVMGASWSSINLFKASFSLQGRSTEKKEEKNMINKWNKQGNTFKM